MLADDLAPPPPGSRGPGALATYGAAQVAFYSTVQSLLQVLAAPRLRGCVAA
jgi:hypothetical protein